MKQGVKVRFWIYLVVLFLTIAASIVAGMSIGTAGVHFQDTIGILLHKLFGMKIEEISDVSVNIIWSLRCPRTIMAIAVGGGLAIAGAAMQAVTQNVLAEPYILGVSSGASAMVTLVYFIGGSLMYISYIVPLFAFLGAVLSLVLVYKIGMSSINSNSSRLVLAGMTVSVILNAASQFFISMMPNSNLIRSITMWMMGSLSGARWNNLLLPCIASGIGLIYFTLNARAYNSLSLGDETAISLGIDARKVKKHTIIAVSFLTGIIVSAAGLIGFVGFIIPHIIRFLVGADHRKLFPLCYLCGGIFLLWMDMIARTIMAPQELAIGIFTAFCGGPFFVWLLYSKNRGNGRKG
ncbi:MAG: iron ABC transporter permease [Lachnospiraceae bacterium]|nr:iron ABC transporter permease [Lachnospiraceae bacterium]MBQ6993812.1 iron ABC transporter permease [Lachnospiraceae bacterium]